MKILIIIKSFSSAGSKSASDKEIFELSQLKNDELLGFDWKLDGQWTWGVFGHKDAAQQEKLNSSPGAG